MRSPKSLKSLRFILIMFVLFIMMAAGSISVAAILLLRSFDVIPQFEPSRLLLTSLVFTMLFGAAIASVMSTFYLRPIKELIHATEEVAKGNFKIRVNVRDDSDSEMSELMQSFNRMVEELGSIEMLRNDFINTFSHEFKTPIVSIRGFAKQLKNDELTPEQRKEYIDIIVSESDRLTRMATNVLLLSKLENQNIITDRTKYSLDEQLRQTVLLLEKQWEAKNISFNINFEPIEVFANAEITSHIWINLLSNAIKFSNRDGAIDMSCKKDNNMVVVSIRDHGCGMNQEQLSHIFDKFYQADSSRKMDGNGLGLSIVSRIVDMYGGKIDVKSSVGKGSLFEVRLKILDEQ